MAAGNFVFPFLTLILTSSLGWSPGKAGIFISAMQLAAMPGILLGGRLGDTFGRKRVILACQALAAAMFLSCLATGFTAFTPWAVAIASMALSMTRPVADAMVADLVDESRRQSAYALSYWANNVGFAMGPLAAGFLFRTAPGLMFAGNAVALVIAIAALAVAIPETLPRHSSGENDQRGAFRVFLARPVLVAFTLLSAGMAFVYSQHTFSVPLYLGELRGDAGPALFGLSMTVNGLTVVLTTLPLARLSRRAHPLASIGAAALLYALGFGLYGFGAGTGLILAATIVWTLGEVLSATNISVFIASQAPETHRARMNSITSILGNVGSLAAPVGAGAFIGAFGSVSLWPALAALSASVAVGLFLLARSARPFTRRA